MITDIDSVEVFRVESESAAFGGEVHAAAEVIQEYTACTILIRLRIPGNHRTHRTALTGWKVLLSRSRLASLSGIQGLLGGDQHAGDHP
jgi:hypothetical protein